MIWGNGLWGTGGSGSGVAYSAVDTYNDLITRYPASQYPGIVIFVRKTTGIIPFRKKNGYWVSDGTKWERAGQGSLTFEHDPLAIKQIYESNPNTNAFTDQEKADLAAHLADTGIHVRDTYGPTPPASPNNMDRWIRSTDGLVFEYLSSLGYWVSIDRFDESFSRGGLRSNLYLNSAGGARSNRAPLIAHDTLISDVFSASSSNGATWNMLVRVNGSTVYNMPVTTSVVTVNVLGLIQINGSDQVSVFAQGAGIRDPKATLLFRVKV